MNKKQINTNREGSRCNVTVCGYCWIGSRSKKEMILCKVCGIGKMLKIRSRKRDEKANKHESERFQIC